MANQNDRPAGIAAPSGIAPAEVAPRLIIGKITPPPQTEDAISRQRLVDEILTAGQRVVLIVAPPGFGKSMLMAQLHELLAARGEATAWLNLDQRDNDLGRFLSYLNAVALRLVPIQQLPSGARGTGPGQYFGLRAEATALIDALACSTRPFSLFIDDVEKIDAPEVIQLLQNLIDNLQDGQRLIIGARGVQLLSTRSLEIRGQLFRVDAERLRFDLQETTQFVHKQHGFTLVQGDVSTVLERTHGWAAALRLVALSLNGRQDCTEWLSTLSGSTRSIAEYLAENVLQRLPEHACQFLIYSSVLDQLNGELCDSILERNDSEELLTQFERTNLFLSRITPLRPEQKAYRFHSLFRDFLLQELQRLDPRAIPELNRRAARWYAAHQRSLPAVDHALLAGDPALAADLMDGCAMGFIEVAQMETVAHWVDNLPAEIAASRLNLQRARAYAMISLHRYAEAEDALRNCRLAATANGTEVPLEVSIQEALLHEFTDRHDLTAVEISQFADHLEHDESMLSGIARNIMAYHHIAHSHFDKAREALACAKLGSEKQRTSAWSSTYTRCFEGLIDLIHGNAREALARFDVAKNRAKGAAVGVAATFMAQVLYEFDDRLGAESLLNEHLRLIRDAADVDTVIIAYRSAARIAFLRGDSARVESLLSELGDLGDARGVTRPKAAAWLEKARFSLLRGDGESARRYLELGSDPRIWAAHEGFHLFAQELEDPLTATARLNIVLGKAEQAIAPLQHAIREAEAGGRRLRRTHLQNLLGQALIANGQRQPGLRLLETTLGIAARNGLVRLIADEPWALPDAVSELCRKLPSTPDYLERIIQAFTPLIQRTDNLGAIAPAANLLSPREAGIIRLVADGRANKEIARLLDISENTVESHLRRINQKLETHNRTQAISKARELGLLR